MLKSAFLAFGGQLCCRPKAKTIFVDARQRNERDARMRAAETGWEQVEAHSEFSCFY
jgi:hypothetical protein